LWYSDRAPILERKYSKSIIHPFKVGSHLGLTINPYQGCQHRCGYCYATYKWSPNFYDKIYGKINAAEILESELNKWKKTSMLPVMISSATDAYQSAEARFGITRKCIKVLQQYHIPFYIFTKSSLIERDLDLFRNYSDDCFIVWSITTVDEQVRRIIEPGTPTASRIFGTISKFVKSGINCCVNIDPIIPFITDSEQQITNIVNKCQQSGLGHISGSVLRMRYDIWSRIRQVLELMNLPLTIKEYEQLYDFQEPIVHENNLTADELYTDKVMSILKYQVLNKNIEFGFEKLIAKISKVKQQFPVSLQQCRISEFL